ncbi:uncharacterized protein [Euphorbia lathyris]|uniref:uncharacterized protein n=1 Tax=Euphorbia lathyris TaxID=212925 RepID=UPI003313B01D
MKYMDDIVSKNVLKIDNIWDKYARRSSYGVDVMNELRRDLGDIILRYGLDNENGGGGRVRRIVKESKYLRSPFISRHPKLLDNMDSRKRRIVEFALSPVLSSDGQTFIDKREILSMSGHDHIVNNIADAWSSILNTEELKKYNGKPKRFFFSTYPFTLLFSGASRSREYNFKERLQNELSFFKF